jgi:hypothetical protein
MKQNLILLLVLMQFISCNTNEKKNVVNENCYIVLNSVSYVIDVYDDRNICLTQMLNELKNKTNIDTKNVSKIQKLSREINKRLTVSLRNLKTEFVKNKNEEIFDVSIQYLSKVKELEKKIPKLVRELSDNIPDNNPKFKESIRKSTAEVEQYELLYHNAMNQYYKVHNMSDKKLDSIENAVEKNTKHSKYLTSS